MQEQLNNSQLVKSPRFYLPRVMQNILLAILVLIILYATGLDLKLIFVIEIISILLIIFIPIEKVKDENADLLDRRYYDYTNFSLFLSIITLLALTLTLPPTLLIVPAGTNINVPTIDPKSLIQTLNTDMLTLSSIILVVLSFIATQKTFIHKNRQIIINSLIVLFLGIVLSLISVSDNGTNTLFDITFTEITIIINLIIFGVVIYLFEKMAKEPLKISDSMN